MKKGLQSKFNPRQYMLSKDFEIYHYMDIPEKKVESHTHNYYECYFFIEGDVTIQIEGTQTPLVKGDMVIIPPGCRHHAIINNPNKPYRRFVFWINKEYYENLQKTSEAYGHGINHVVKNKAYVYANGDISFNDIRSKVLQLLEEIHGDGYGKAVKIELLVNDLVLHINRIIYEKINPDVPKTQQSIQQRLISYIEEHLDEDLSLEHLANQFYVNKYYIAHLFKADMGLSIHQFITRKRLSKCEKGLLGNEGIGELYQQYGFKDYSSFYRAFKKEYGCSPREYIRSHLPEGSHSD